MAGKPTPIFYLAVLAVIFGLIGFAAYQAFAPGPPNPPVAVAGDDDRASGGSSSGTNSDTEIDLSDITGVASCLFYTSPSPRD